MADISPHLLLPYILAAQAQKHVTHNEAIRLLDAVVQLSVLDRDLTATSHCRLMATATSWPRRQQACGRAGI